MQSPQLPPEARPTHRADAPPPEAPPPLPPGGLKRRRNAGLKWLKRLALAALVVVLAVFVVHWRWGRRVAGELDAQLASIRAAGEPTNVAELNAWPAAVSGAGDNAVPHLRGAADQIYEGDPAWKAYSLTDAYLPMKDDEVAAYEAAVTKFDAALRSADEATAPSKSRVDWGLEYKSPMFEHLGVTGDLNGMRAVASLLKADAMLSFHRGDHARAVRRARQMVRVARAVDHQPSLVGHLVAIGVTASAAALACELVPDLRIGTADGAVPAEEVRALIAEFLDDRPLREGFRRALAGERVLQLDAATGMANGTIDTTNMGGGRSGARVPIPGATYALRPVFRDNALIMARFMTETMAAAAKSPDWPAYLQNAPPRPAEADGHGGIFQLRYKLVEILLPVFDRAARQDYRCMADRRLAATCLAARLYAADHEGRYPGSLEELVPDYLPSVPPDPFSKTGATLLYVNAAADPEKPRVYSVAENGDDNGGVELDRRLPRMQAEKISDEVRHLKRQPRPTPVEFPAAGYPGVYPGMVPGTFPGMPGVEGDEADDEAEADEPAMEEGDAPLQADEGAPPADAFNEDETGEPNDGRAEDPR